MTPMTRRALYLQDAHPIRNAIAYTQYAEEKGFEAVWQADSRLSLIHISEPTRPY